MTTQTQTTETVIFVEFDSSGRPFQVMTLETHKTYTCINYYDFTYSKRYGRLSYHLSGFGSLRPLELYQAISLNEDGSHTPVEVIYWASDMVEVKEPPLCKRLATLPEDYTAEKLFDGYTASECGSVTYCSECDDYFPDSWYTYCEHIWYCDICEDISTPDDRCEHEKGAES